VLSTATCYSMCDRLRTPCEYWRECSTRWRSTVRALRESGSSQVLLDCLLLAVFAPASRGSPPVIILSPYHAYLWIQTDVMVLHTSPFSAAFFLLNSATHSAARGEGTTKILTTSSTIWMLALVKTFSSVAFFPTLTSPPVMVSM
jgi:hypothetical protein